MLSLFSMFDPVTFSFLSLNWISSILGLFFFPQFYWFFYSRILFTFLLVEIKLYLEFKLILKFKFNLNNLIFILTLFMYLYFNNFLGLFPYIFTSSSHLTFSFTFSLSMWLGAMLFGWVENTKFMLIHLVPLGTPFMLMFFMVLIEFLSNIIRPLTLAIRLVANMVAGHLLLTLMGDFISSYFVMYMFVLMLQLMLLGLEFMVSLIQSYVFAVLLVLYMKETN